MLACTDTFVLCSDVQFCLSRLGKILHVYFHKHAMSCIAIQLDDAENFFDIDSLLAHRTINVV